MTGARSWRSTRVSSVWDAHRDRSDAVTAATDTRYPPGTLVAARGREWVVLPDSTARFLVARPLNGDTEFTTGLFPQEVLPARFPPPRLSDGEVGDHLAAVLLRTALRIGFTSSAS